jgi:hypothetical protein
LLQTGEIKEGIRKRDMFDTVRQLSQHIINRIYLNDSLAGGAEQREARRHVLAVGYALWSSRRSRISH